LIVGARAQHGLSVAHDVVGTIEARVGERERAARVEALGLEAEEALVRGDAVLEAAQATLAARDGFEHVELVGHQAGERGERVELAFVLAEREATRGEATQRIGVEGADLGEAEEGVARVGEALLVLLREAEVGERDGVLGIEAQGAREGLDGVGHLPELHAGEAQAELRFEALGLLADHALEGRARGGVVLDRFAELAEQVVDLRAIGGELGASARGLGGLGVAPERAQGRRVLDAELRVVALVEARFAELGRCLGVVALGERVLARGAVHLAERHFELDTRRIEGERAGEAQDGLGGLSVLALGEAEAAEELGVVGALLDGATQRFGFFLRVFRALVARGDQRPQAGIVGLGVARHAERRERFVVAIEPRQHLAEAARRARALGIEGEPRLLLGHGLGVSPREGQGLGEAEMRLGVVRPRAQALLEGLERLVDLASRPPHLGELAVRIGGIARAAGGLFEVLRGELELPGLGEQHAEIEVRVGEAGIQGERGLQLATRVGGAAERDERARVVEVGLGERGAEGEGLLQGALRLALRVEEQVREAQRAQGLDVARPEIVGALERIHGLLVATELKVEPAHSITKTRLFRRERGGAAQGLLGEIELAQGLPAEAELEESLGGLGRHGREAHRLLELDDRLGVALLLREDQALQAMRGGVVGSPPNGLAHVGERVLAQAEAKAALGEPEEGLAVARVEPRRREQGRHGGRVIVQPAQRDPEPPLRVGAPWIGRDRRLVLLHRVAQLLELARADGRAEVRLDEARAQRRGLAKGRERLRKLSQGLEVRGELEAQRRVLGANCDGPAQRARRVRRAIEAFVRLGEEQQAVGVRPVEAHRLLERLHRALQVAEPQLRAPEGRVIFRLLRRELHRVPERSRGGLEALEREQARAERRVHLGAIRQEARRPLQHGHGLLVLARARERLASLDLKLCVVREQRHGSLRGLRGAARVAHGLAGPRQRHPRFGGFVALLHVREQRVARARIHLKLGPRQAQVEQQLRIVRRLLAREREEALGLVEARRFQRDIRRAAQQRDHVRLERERRRVRLRGEREVSALRVLLRERDMRRDQLGLELERLAQAALRFIPLPLLGEEGPERRVPGRVLGLVLHRAAKRRQSLAVPAELLVGLAELRALLRVFGIEEQAVLQDANQPLQVDVGHGLVTSRRSPGPSRRQGEPSVARTVLVLTLEWSSPRRARGAAAMRPLPGRPVYDAAGRPTPWGDSSLLRRLVSRRPPRGRRLGPRSSTACSSPCSAPSRCSFSAARAARPPPS
jgi:hypothetical protein